MPTFLPRKIVFGEQARKKVLSGVVQLHEAVAATMGPSGRFAVLDRENFPNVTRDGVTVAKDIHLSDHFENIGCKLAKEAAEKTNTEAGDGTTTTVVLTETMMQLGMKELGVGRNAMAMKRGMLFAAEKLDEFLKEDAITVEDKAELKDIATVSANDEEIGSVVSDLIHDLGDNAVITVALSNKPKMEVERVEGLQFDEGFVLPHFINHDDKRKCLLTRPYIFLCEGTIRDVGDILPIMEQVGGTADKTLLVICNEMVNPALNFFVTNVKSDKMDFYGCVVQNPEFGARRREFLEDLAVVTGGQLMSPMEGMQADSFPIASLGRAEGAIISPFNTTIIDGAGTKEAIEGRIQEMKDLSEQGFSDFEKDKISRRIARITNGIAVINVNGATATDQKEKVYRVEDALNATKAAFQEGIVAGGGVAYIRARQKLGAIEKPDEPEDFHVGVEIVLNAMTSCTSKIAQNAGANGEHVVEKVKELKDNQGYNALTDKYEDLVKAKVVDPLKVMRSALRNAVSIASMFVIMECAVADDAAAMSSGLTEEETEFFRKTLRAL